MNNPGSAPKGAFGGDGGGGALRYTENWWGRLRRVVGQERESRKALRRLAHITESQPYCSLNITFKPRWCLLNGNTQHSVVLTTLTNPDSQLHKPHRIRTKHILVVFLPALPFCGAILPFMSLRSHTTLHRCK